MISCSILLNFSRPSTKQTLKGQSLLASSACRSDYLLSFSAALCTPYLLIMPSFASKMLAAALGAQSMLVMGASVPTKVGDARRDLSLPPLIPSIPGVTEPLTSNAPPLPVLQLPTPPLDSPPFTPSNIKPKKIGYFWTGSGDKWHKDFLATYSLDDVSLRS